MRIGIYCRVSGDNQKDNTSLQNQREKGIEFCKRNEFEYEIFSEVISGGTSQRKELEKLEYKLLNGLLEGVWLFDWDRMIRDVEVMMYFRNLIKDSKCRVYVDNDEKNIFEDSGSLEFGIRSLLSDYERRKIKSRMDFGKRRRLEEGNIILGVIGVGYKKLDNKVVVDESLRKVIEDCFKIYLDKRVNSWRDLIRRLKLKYGNNLDKRINEKGMFRILQDDKYKGIQKIYWNNDLFEIPIGRIIDDNLFEEVNNKIQKIKKLRKGNQKDNYLLKGKVKCQDCENIMWIRKGGGNYKLQTQIYGYYSCQSNRKNNRKDWDNRFDDIIKLNCNSISSNIISVNKLERVIWEILFHVRRNSDIIKKEYYKKFEKINIHSNKMKGKLGYYEKLITENEGKKVIVIDLFINGEIDKEEKNIIMNKIKIDSQELIKKRNEVKNEYDKLEIKNKIYDYLDYMNNNLDMEYKLERFEDRKRLIDKYIEEIQIKITEINNKKQKIYSIGVKFNIDTNNLDFMGNNNQNNIKGNNYNIYISNTKTT